MICVLKLQKKCKDNILDVKMAPNFLRDLANLIYGVL